MITVTKDAALIIGIEVLTIIAIAGAFVIGYVTVRAILDFIFWTKRRMK